MIFWARASFGLIGVREVVVGAVVVEWWKGSWEIIVSLAEVAVKSVAVTDVNVEVSCKSKRSEAP